MKSESNLTVRRMPKKGTPYLRVYEGADIQKFQKQSINELTLEGKRVIRWGNRIEAKTDKSTIVYNKSEAIANATNKKLSREIFLKEKVRCPKAVTPKNVENADYPIIARPSTHAKGKNFIILKTADEFNQHYGINSASGWYYSAFINKEREFRVHCAHGKILAIMEKSKGGDKIAWNRAQTGEAFTRVSQKDYIFTICFQALKAIKVLGLDFGGVDVMLITENGKPQGYVLEVNTSPTLNSSDFVSSQYAKYFDWLGRGEKRREHWDYTKFKAPDSFAWKQDQLTS
jgi:glutathione synthase/RimK-type ligase-like ATP-grasp enzyme